MHEKILVPTDGSTEADRGAREGVELAAALGATLCGLYVVEDGGNPWSSESMDDQLERAEAYGQGILDELGEMADDAGVPYESEVRVGPNVHEKIIDYATGEDVDLIVMGSGYYGKFGGMLGSTTDKVLRSAEISVLSVPDPDHR